MLAIDRRAVRVAWSVFVFALVLYLAYLMRRTLLVFVLSVLFAYLLAPIVDYLQKFLRRTLKRPSARVLSLVVVYILLVGILVVAGTLIGTKIVEQTGLLAQGAPEYLKQLQAKLDTPGPAWFEPVRRFLQSEVSSRLQNAAGMIAPVLKKVGESALSIMGNVVIVVLVPILGFFFLKDGASLKQMWVDEFVNEDRRPIVENILNDIHQLLGHFMRALVLLSLATFTSYSIFLMAVGVPYGLLLALTAALLEFIPVIGTTGAAVLIIIVSAVTGSHVLLVVIFMAAYRLVQDYVLQPHLMSHGVELHPLAVIFGVLAGEQVAGVAGMFLSIPVMAILRVVYFQMQRLRVAEPTPVIRP